MPPIRSLKTDGTKLIPAGRFNLGPAKPSNSFVDVPEKRARDTILIRHPIVRSVTAITKPSNLNITDESLPFIIVDKPITISSVFKDSNNPSISWKFPTIEISPYNNTVFYYEEILSTKAEKQGYEGYVILKYLFKRESASLNIKVIPIKLKEVILLLKAGKESIRINGIIDEEVSCIRFQLINEAVKIAFTNLISNLESNSCSLLLYFDFKGNYTSTDRFRFARKINTQIISDINPLRLNPRKIELKTAISRMINFTRKGLIQKVVINKGLTVPAEKPLVESQRRIIKHASVKTTFLLRHSQILHYPLGTSISDSLYKTSSGGFITNPFNLNQDYSEFQQIFLPEISFDKVAVYKSLLQPNTFLLIAKNYYLTRTEDTFDPCILSIFHAFEEGTSTSQDISEIEFQFAIGPEISQYDLAKLKYHLYKNQYIEKSTVDFVNDIRFLFPQDLDAKYEIMGNQFLQKSEVTIDGKYFIFSLFTDNLAEASILINSLNNSCSQFANIAFRHKEIADSSIVDINIEKTIGDVISGKIENENLLIENLSLSECKVKGLLTIDTQNNFEFNQTYFENFEILKSGEKKSITTSSVMNSYQTGKLKNVLFDYESIENLSKEFEQIVSQSTDYNRYITIKFDSQKDKTAKIQLKITVVVTANNFSFVKLKSDFKVPFLFNFIITNTSNNSSTELNIEIEYFDNNDNIYEEKSIVFKYGNSATLTVPPCDS